MCTKHQFDGDYSPNVEQKSALIFTLACISENLCIGTAGLFLQCASCRRIAEVKSILCGDQSDSRPRRLIPDGLNGVSVMLHRHDPA